RRAHAGLAGFHGYVRRRLDLRAVEQSRIHRTSSRAGVRGSAVRSARRVSNLENASFSQETSRWREAGALRRKIAAVRRLVRDAAELSRRRADYRRPGTLSRYAERSEEQTY